MFYDEPSDITHVSIPFKVLPTTEFESLNFLTFKEPDKSAHGGSNISPAYGAQTRVDNILPLHNMGIRAGLSIPAVSADYGQHWLEDFLGNCARIFGKYLHV